MALGDATTAQPNTGGINWASIIPLLAGAGMDISSLIQGTDTKNAATAANLANPLIPLQGQALGQLGSFLTDPSSVLKDPAFQAAEQLGAENISRQAGAAGMAGSGNRLADLFKFGETAGLGYEQQRFDQLMGVLRPSPAAGQFFMQGQQGKQDTIADLLRQLFGGAGGASLLPSILKMITGGGGGGGDLTGINDSGGITAGGLDTGGTLGDLQPIDFGGGAGTGDFFTGGSGDMFQIIDQIGG